ncbi:MAG: hypothetical protein E2O39_05890 [Planctomycetota bacterium]|nr:MAG: hypothetical protein E2O39_05890 [Planctomycetota bacterium]
MMERDGSHGAPARVDPGAKDRRRLLAGGSPREILTRIVRGDPLGVRRIVARRLRERALLMDGDHVHLRALARCARYAVRYAGRPTLDEWLAGHVDGALDAAIVEEAEERAEDRVPGGPWSAHAELARPLGLEPNAMRAACRAFHARPDLERQAFFSLVIEVSDLDDVARAEGVSASEVARRARRALDAILLSQHPHAEESGPHASPRKQGPE